MFSWAAGSLEKLSASASEKLERLSQTVAPAPTDPPSRFLYTCQRGDENAAIACWNELGGNATVLVNPSKGQTPIHLACLQSMPNLVRHVLVGGDIHQMDAAGNTPLHCAAMSSHSQNALIVVKLLIQEYQASVTIKNTAGQTPYDVASLNAVRQYLLPLQLQEETRIALDNGGVGLPPGIDLGGMKIKNSHLPPPPVGVMGAAPPVGGPQQMYVAPPMGAPQMPAAPPAPEMVPPSAAAPAQPTPPAGLGMPPPPAMSSMAGEPRALSQPPPPAMSSISTEPRSSSQPATPSPSAIPPAPTSTGSDYARRGYSSAAIGIRGAQGRRVLQPDGFHSSSSDKNLQAKYGHQTVTMGRAVPPPPRSGDSSHAQSAPPSIGGGANPFALSSSGSGAVAAVRRSRYVAVDPITGQQQSQQNPYAQPPVGGQAPVPSYGMFAPGMQQAAQPQAYQQPQQPYPQQQPSLPQQQQYSPQGYQQQPPVVQPPSVSPSAAASIFQTPSPTKPPVQQAPTSGNSASAVFSVPAAPSADTTNAGGMTTVPPTASTTFAPPSVNTAPPSSGNSPFAGPPGSGNSPFAASGGNANDLFSRPPAESSATSGQSTTEAAAIESVPAAEKAAQAHVTEAAKGTVVAAPPASSADTEDDTLQEVPLSPPPAHGKSTIAAEPAAANGDQSNSLYAAIGMPPPPMSKS